MAASIGEKLSQARLQRGLTIDEAAHATKLRPDKLLALENDDYGRFPSNAYAKGFLLIYGRFLKVDVAAHAAALDTSHTIRVGEYQYLSTASEPQPESRRDVPDLRKRRAPSVMPLLAFCGVALTALFLFTVYVNWQRITGETVRQETPPVSRAAGASAETLAPPPVAEAPAIARAAVSDRDFLAAAPAPVAGPEPEPASADRDVVTATPVQMNEIEITAARRTWVTIRRDDPKSLPVYEDYLYPGTHPLKLKGTRILIEVRDPASVQIMKNGTPMAYQEPGVTIQ